MDTINQDAKSVELFASQLGEAWSHYRHCESLRTQYLTIFFTIFLGATGFIINLFKTVKDEPVSAAILFGIAIMTNVLFCFSGTFYVCIFRLGLVTEFYFHVMEDTRRFFFGTNPYLALVWSYKRIDAHPVGSKFFGVQKATQVLIIFLCYSLVATQALIAYLISIEYKYAVWRNRLTLVFCLVMFLITGFLIFQAHAARGKARRDREALLSELNRLLYEDKA